MKTPTSLILLASAVAIGLSACSGDSGEPADSGAETAAVEIADSRFQPHDLDVPAGTSVTWTNNDGDIPHTVTFDDASVADSDQLAGGETFTVAFDAAGTYSYVCALHPEMTASVTVTS